MQDAKKHVFINCCLISRYVQHVMILLCVVLRIAQLLLNFAQLTENKDVSFELFVIAGEKHGYNIPEVTSAPNVSNWLTEDGIKLINSCRDDKMLPDHAKRLICDGYMCFYQSPQVMMYQ